MKLALALLLLAMPVPRAGVYVRGHSHAADKVRENLTNFTCYSPAGPKNSANVLQVDHILAKSGRSWLVMILTDARQKLLWEGKAEEYPWPIPSPLGRLLRSMAKSTCQDSQDPTVGRAPTQPSQAPLSPSRIPNDALVHHSGD
jgi:hypothetical protein